MMSPAVISDEGACSQVIKQHDDAWTPLVSGHSDAWGRGVLLGVQAVVLDCEAIGMLMERLVTWP